ncbi:tyrosine-protein phosphatase non-receptor type 1-like [Haliotis cracherodii]|uniref:tyrosine-protein phosphatase non-receptor type 1-like n=1 Tax=Haliotis cracherodii TaxID=6455 RepID=UPI0039E7BA86
MSRLENEFLDYDSAKIWNEVYQRVKNEASLKTLDNKFGVAEARKPENKHKNRYRDVSPYDHSRVVLSQGDTDYINASYIQVTEARRKYILTQGPLDHTTPQFWQMIWEQKTKAVVMLNRIIEKGTLKCHQYWPLGSHLGYEDEMVFDEVDLKVTLNGEQEGAHFTVRSFYLEDMQSGERREVLHFHYTTWPDFCVPASPTSFLNFLSAVREAGALDTEVGPAVIHCSAGIGRSGTFCLVDSCLVLIEKNQDLDCVDVRGMLIEMRSYRMGLIQTPDQLRFSYLAIIEGGKQLLNMSDANSNVRDSMHGQFSNHNDHEDSPPPPPERTTSLSPKRGVRHSPPPLPPKLRRLNDDDDDDDEDIDAELDKLIDDDDEGDNDDDDLEDEDDFMDMTGTTRLLCNSAPDKEQESAYEVRKRIREERKKHTQEKIKDMKERQKNSEAWKKRKSYLQPICLGLGLLLGSYLLYKYYWRY